MYSDHSAVRGTVWFDLADAKQITYRLEPDEDSARFTVLGPVEVELDLPRDLVRHCRDLFDAALAELAGNAERRP
ncbi:hypothetical protein ABZ816_32475 [Actinosynnema sp. NPDC047251]|uniref:Uncharacterized protein n=1 Tax=Saccharothrix espanaensis (strain ATCC 51144 / DSM 44229 / JCM 9112 / NBRC 15066 / NRRL 15764) TaxID=1179773 RepID=K3W474_SACES|nr:hypothetical protein [Saccharothrix espanaensis]CCH27497.1 hypothetical protein BN6_01650 [Saccharothrix espanaensis DSM 44229]